MNRDLRDFLQLLQQQRPADFVSIEKRVDPDREPAALLSRIEAEGSSPVLHFRHIGESEFPLVANVHGTRERLALALGTNVEDLAPAYIRRLRTLLPPVLVPDAPVHEVVVTGDEVDLRALPLVIPSDNCVAPYLGGGIAVARDPVSGIRNLSYNRLMLVAPNRLSFHAAPGQHLNTICENAAARGEDLPMAIVIGYHPAIGLGALAKMPFDVDEYDCASALLEAPLELVRCTSIELEVPASAEIILEGKVLLEARAPEGPYDEFTGYAMPQEMQPVFEVTAITHRHGALYQDIFGSSREHLLVGAIPKEASLLSRLKAMHPLVADVHYPLSGCGRLHAVISLGKHAPPEARRTIISAFALDHFLKHIFIVDDDIDVRDDAEVLRAMATCFQGDRDTIVLERMLGSSLDPSAAPGAIAAKVGFDCTRKGNFPPQNRLAPEILQRMNPEEYAQTL